eukprot:760632-Hanusia_phi.AAC.5
MEVSSANTEERSLLRVFRLRFSCMPLVGQAISFLPPASSFLPPACRWCSCCPPTSAGFASCISLSFLSARASADPISSIRFFSRCARASE